jgi:hypothetical protein
MRLDVLLASSEQQAPTCGMVCPSSRRSGQSCAIRVRLPGYQVRAYVLRQGSARRFRQVAEIFVGAARGTLVKGSFVERDVSPSSKWVVDLDILQVMSESGCLYVLPRTRGTLPRVGICLTRSPIEANHNGSSDSVPVTCRQIMRHGPDAGSQTANRLALSKVNRPLPPPLLDSDAHARTVKTHR